MSETINIRPLHDRILVEPAAAEEITQGGIIIPDNARERPQKGVVIAVGPGTKDEPMLLKPGESILYNKYAGSEIHHEGKGYLIMRESDVLAVM